MQQLLKFKMRWGRPYVLVRWAGCDASRDTWEPLDNLTNCEAAIAALERASALRAALCHAPPRRRRLSPPPCLSPRQALPLMLRRRVISARSSWGGRCSTGGRPTGGSAVQSPASASAEPSRTWSPTHGRRLRCAAPQTRSLMLPRMATVGSCFLRLPPPAWTGLPPHPRSPAGRAARAPGPDFQVGRWLVTAGPGPGRAGCCVLFALVYIVEPGAR